MHMDDFGELRALLQRGASQKTWEALTAYLVEHVELWEESRRDTMLAYCTGHLSKWPGEIPTFAPRGWFSGHPGQVAAHPLTPFFVFCFQERTPKLRDTLIEALRGHRAKRLPSHLDVDHIYALRWRHNQEEIGEAMTRHLIAFLKDAASSNTYEERITQVRHLFMDEDAHAWSRWLVNHTLSCEHGQDITATWPIYQSAYFGSSNITHFALDPEHEYNHFHHRRITRAVNLLGLVGDRQALTRLSTLVLDGELEASYMSMARRRLDEALARGRRMALQDFFRIHTDYNAPLYEMLEACAIASRWELGRFAAQIEHAMCSQSQIPVTLLRRLLDEHGDDMGALGWILFKTPDRRILRLTKEGAVNVDGNSVHLEEFDAVVIAHPVAMVRRKELSAWWTHFAEAEIEDFSVQFEREVYHDITDSIVPHGGIPIHFPEHYDFFDLSDQGRAYRRRRADASPGTYVSHHILRHAPARQTWYMELYAFESDGIEVIEQVQVHSRATRYGFVSDDRARLSEICRFMRRLKQALTFDKLPGGT